MNRPVPEPVGPGQESVWDYPRPPRVEPTAEDVEVWLGGVRVAVSRRALRVLETSHPPAYYLPFEDFEPGGRDTAGRWVLRRVGHLAGRRPVQGWTRHLGLVSELPVPDLRGRFGRAPSQSSLSGRSFVASSLRAFSEAAETSSAVRWAD
ncbi:MAG: hypothetical protein K0R30_687, partial [Ornithinibacter sp.]|nr:hypothetical protein [Ornithinibacter sp.]